jgi:hypothetical protein
MSDTPTVYVDLLKSDNKATRSKRPQRYRWVARNGGNQKILARSSKSYNNAEDCLAAIEQLFGTGTDVTLRREGEDDVELRAAAG